MRTTGTTGVYTISSNETGRVYVGSTVNMAHRFSQHRQALRRASHDNKYLQNHFAKYGESDLSFNPLIVCDRKDLEMYETRAIKTLIGGDRAKGFNIGNTARSTLGVPLSNERKAHMSKMRKGMPSRLTDEGRKALSEAHKGKVRTEAEKQAIRDSKLGKPRSESDRSAISEGTKKAMAKMDKDKFIEAQRARVYSKPRGPSPILIEDPALADEYLSGKTVTYLSKVYGRHRNVIKRSLCSLGVTLRTKREVAIQNLGVKEHA